MGIHDRLVMMSAAAVGGTFSTKQGVIHVSLLRVMQLLRMRGEFRGEQQAPR